MTPLGKAARHVQFLTLKPVVAEVRDVDVLAQTKRAGVRTIAAGDVKVYGGLQVL